jgi:ElaB/YqjD/DUF883 family membrane-anchored ribosome-binding protein
MRNSSTHSGNLANEIALLKKQLDDLSSSVSDSGESIFARGEAALGTVKKAKDTLIEQTETRPLTTLAVVAGIGFLAGLLYRRN